MEHTLYIQASSIMHELCCVRAADSEKESYQAVAANPDLYAILQEMAAAIQCRLCRGRNRLFIVPEPDNAVLGYTTSKLREEFAARKDGRYYSLQKVMFFVMLNMFYDTPNTHTKNREAVAYSVLMQETRKFLHHAAQEENRLQTGTTWGELEKFYDNLLPSTEDIGKLRSGSKSVWTRREAAVRLFHKLKAHELIAWDEKEDVIRPLPLLDDQVEFLLEDLASGDLYAYREGGSENA